MPLKKLKDGDIYLEVKYNSNNDEYFLLPGNCPEYNSLCNHLFNESTLMYGKGNKYIKEAIYDHMPILAINSEKLLPALSFFSSSPFFKHLKIIVTGPVARPGKNGKIEIILKTLIIDCNKQLDYKHAYIFLLKKRSSPQSNLKKAKC